jgi:hypothetical protein
MIGTDLRSIINMRCTDANSSTLTNVKNSTEPQNSTEKTTDTGTVTTTLDVSLLHLLTLKDLKSIPALRGSFMVCVWRLLAPTANSLLIP